MKLTATSSSVADLHSHLGFWLRAVSNHVSQGFAQKLATRDVTPAEWVIMRKLFDSAPLAPSKVADALGMTRGAITKLADRLIAKGFVVRVASVEDGRAQTLALTRGGRRLVPSLAQLADQNDAEFFGDLTKAERQTLERFLKRIVERRGLTAMPVD